MGLEYLLGKVGEMRCELYRRSEFEGKVGHAWDCSSKSQEPVIRARIKMALGKLKRVLG